MGVLYGALLLLAWAAVLPYQMVIGALSGRPRAFVRERLGLVDPPAPAAGHGVWVHAVSVGEVRLALLLIAALRDRFPGLSAVLTTGTVTGRALAMGTDRPTAAWVDRVAAMPIDLPGTMGRFLARVRPRAVIVIETEIWPVMLQVCGRSGIPVAIVNGRISPRAYRRYRLLRRFLAGALRHVTLFAMQTGQDAARVRDLGAPADRVEVLGNLKFDLPVPDVETGTVRRRIGLTTEPLFVAGSTDTGEESPILDAFRILRATEPRVRLLIAPRHPERFAAAGASLRAAGLRVATWSALETGVPAPPGDPGAGAPLPWDAMLIDAIGVLPQLYAAADVVFVGGSLTRRGGQNLLEPAAMGRPVLFGPHVDNFRAAADSLIDAGGGFVVRDGAELGRLAARFLADPAARDQAGERARRVVVAERGALQRTVDRLARILDPHREAGRALSDGQRLPAPVPRS